MKMYFRWLLSGCCLKIVSHSTRGNPARPSVRSFRAIMCHICHRGEHGKIWEWRNRKTEKCHHYKTRSLCNATTIRGSRDAKQKCRDLEFKDWELEEAMSKVRRLALILNLGTIWTCWRLVVQDHMRGLVIIWILWGKADFWFEETLDAIQMQFGFSCFEGK